MANFYLVPKVQESTPTGLMFVPKYFASMNIAPRASMDYGLDPQFLVCAEVTPEQHAFLQAQSDVLVIPPLDDVVGGNPTLNQVRNRLENENIPATWIQSTTTWRLIVGRVGRYCLILQRLHRLHNKRLFEPGTTLDSQLSPTLLAQLQDVGRSLGLNVSALTLSTIVRDALTGLGDQLPAFVLLVESF